MSKKNRIVIGGKIFVLASKKKSTRAKADKEAKAKALEEREANAITQAAEIYEAWKKMMVKESCPPDAIPGRVLALMDTLKKEVSDKRIRNVVIELVKRNYRVAVEVFKSRPSEQAGG